MGKSILKYFKHETKSEALKRFLLTLAVFVAYFLYVSFKHGAENGLLIAWLTWSFFVLCTPIADAGFLVDFPVRLILKIKMLYSEIFVWAIAISLNIYAFFFAKELYLQTPLLKVFYKILANPYPYWIIILLSGVGTFMSVYFGDELFDVASHKERDKFHKHKHKWLLVSFFFIFAFTLFLYYELIEALNLSDIIK